MRTENAVRSFLEAKADLSPRTVEQYVRVLADLVRQCPKMPSAPQPIRQAFNQAESVWLRDAYWRVWRGFFRWCHLEYGIPDPMERVERPRLPDIEMKALEPEELAMVLAAAHTVRDKAVVALALDSGVRASEFGPLRTVDVGGDTIRLWGKGNRQARVPISPETRHLLRVLASQDGKGPLFADLKGGPVSRHCVYNIVRRCMRRAGIPGPKLGPHRLRHSLGKNFIADGGDPFTLQRVMRHRNIATTQKYVALAMHDVVEQHHRHSPLRRAMQGAQGMLWERQVEEVLEKVE